MFTPINRVAVVHGGIGHVKMACGAVSLFDADDLEKVAKHKHWSLNSVKYPCTNICVDGKWKTLMLHRLVLPGHKVIDHIDSNPLNNQKYNLRPCTQKQNVRNQRPRTGGSSRFKGVYFNNRTKLWVARITVDYKMIYIGAYDTEIGAAIAYNDAAHHSFGKFAKPNLIIME